MMCVNEKSFRKTFRGAEDKLKETPVAMSMSISVSGLTVGTAYTCLRYDQVLCVVKYLVRLVFCRLIEQL